MEVIIILWINTENFSCCVQENSKPGSEPEGYSNPGIFPYSHNWADSCNLSGLVAPPFPPSQTTIVWGGGNTECGFLSPLLSARSCWLVGPEGQAAGSGFV